MVTKMNIAAVNAMAAINWDMLSVSRNLGFGSGLLTPGPAFCTSTAFLTQTRRKIRVGQESAGLKEEGGLGMGAFGAAPQKDVLFGFLMCRWPVDR